MQAKADLLLIKETSFFKISFILTFLFRNKKRTKEMRPLKRRGRLAAHKVPNFIRHTVTELLGYPIKGKTQHIKFTPK